MLYVKHRRCSEQLLKKPYLGAIAEIRNLSFWTALLISCSLAKMLAFSSNRPVQSRWNLMYDFNKDFWLQNAILPSGGRAKSTFFCFLLSQLSRMLSSLLMLTTNYYNAVVSHDFQSNQFSDYICVMVKLHSISHANNNFYVTRIYQCAFSWFFSKF